MKYIVSEIQTFGTGQVAVFNYAHDARDDAEAKFYTLCAGGAKTSLPIYTVMMFSEEGFILDTKCFKHEQPAPEPEPEKEETVPETDEEETAEE